MYDRVIFLFITCLLILHGCTGAAINQAHSGACRGGPSLTGDMTNATISTIPAWLVFGLVGLAVCSGFAFILVFVKLAKHHQLIRGSRA